MTTDTDRIEELARQYLLTSGGDGFSSEIVSGAELDEAFIKLHYDPASDCPADERKSMLEHLHDEDNWEMNYELGPIRYEQRYEDGYVAVTLITSLSAELTEAKIELKRHLTSSVEYDLVDGIRQLAQVALTNKGNVKTLEASLTEWKIRCAELEQNAVHIQSSEEAEDLKRVLDSCSAELAELRQQIEKIKELRQAKESLDWWIDDYLSGRSFNWNRMPPYLKSRLEGKK